MSLISSLFFFFFLFSFFFLLLFLARFLLTVPCLWYLTVNHRNRFQISTQLSFPIRSGQLVPQLFSLFFFFFLSFFSFFFLLLSLARFLLTVPSLWYLTVNHRNRFQISTQLSFPIRSGQLVPQLFSLFFFFFFSFFSFFFPPSFPCSLSSYRAMPLVFNRQSSQPFPNKYTTKFSHLLWTTCPSALLSFFFFLLSFFSFFSLLLFLARFLLTVPCLWYLTVNHRNRFQISTQLSFPIRSGQLVPQLLSLFFFSFFFFFFFFPPSFPCSLSSYRAMPLVFNRQSSQPFPNKYATMFSHPLWTTFPSALLSFFFFSLFFFFFSSFFSLLAFFLPCHAFGI